MQMGMDRPFPFASTLNSVNFFLEKYDIDLEKWWNLVSQSNSRTQVLLKRVEAEKGLSARNTVVWVSLGVLVVFTLLIIIGWVVVYFWGWLRGERGGEELEEKVLLVEKLEREEEVLADVINGIDNVIEEKDVKDVLPNGNEIAKEKAKPQADGEMLALKKVAQATRAEIERLTTELQHARRREIKTLAPLREEADGLKSQVELLSKVAKHQEQDREALEKRLHDSSSECENLKKSIKKRDLEITQLQACKSEVNELCFQLESCRAQLESKEKEVGNLKAVKEKIEQDLKAAYNDFETANIRAAESYDHEAKFRTENAELTKRIAGQLAKHKASMISMENLHEKDLSKRQLAHEKQMRDLKDEFEIKIKEAKGRRRQRPDSVASSSLTEVEENAGRLTPTRLLASLKRHSRSSLPRSISGSFKSSEGKDGRNGR